MEDNKLYLVLSGNEFGVELDMDAPTKFCDREEAEKLYQRYLDEEYFAAAMFEVTEFCLIPVKRSYDEN